MTTFVRSRKAEQDKSVSGHARSERALRASELSYRRLFETAKDGILILDAETGRINEPPPQSGRAEVPKQ
jgi:PAS domain-containing protein